MVSTIIRCISGASQRDNLRLYHAASPLRRQNRRFCLNVPRLHRIMVETVVSSDFSDFDFAVFLAMAGLGVNALFGMVANHADFVAFDLPGFDFG